MRRSTRRRPWIPALAMLAATASAAAALDISAGPIWNDLDAQGNCPGVCTSAGGSWNGNWVTTAPGQNSVCTCDIGRRGRDKVADYDAGPIWSNADAHGKCPGVCTSHDRKWTGDWRTTRAGQMSTCSCSR